MSSTLQFVRTVKTRDAFRGFTLIELMITIAILAILATIAVPSFQRVTASTRLSSATNELYASLIQAKNDAIRKGNRVTVCKSTDQATCISTATATWSTGWITFDDLTRGNVLTVAAVDAGDIVRQINNGVASDIVILAASTASASNYVSFAADGRPRETTGGFQAGRIRICSTSSALDNDSRAREIVFLASGRIAIERPTAVANTCPAPAAT